MTEITNINLQLTLESVQKAFNGWRKSRIGNEKIPDDLWGQVLKILPNYPKRQLLNTLGLNHSQLKKHLISIPNHPAAKIAEPSIKHPKPDIPFVQAFIPPLVSSGYQVEWQRADGTKLIINQLDIAGLNALVQQLGGQSC